MKDENVKNMGSVRDGEFTGKVYRVYKIISPIGQGKFSFVFKTLNIKTG